MMSAPLFGWLLRQVRWMTQGSSSELETSIVAEDIDKSRHVPDVYTS